MVRIPEHPLVVELRSTLDNGGDPERVLKRIDRKLRKPPVGIGASEVAEILGVPSRQNIYKLTGLPEHIGENARGKLWDPDTIKAFAKTYKKRGKS